MSMPAIGKFYGDKHHTTVLNAIRRVPEIIGRSARVANDVAIIRGLLQERYHDAIGQAQTQISRHPLSGEEGSGKASRAIAGAAQGNPLVAGMTDDFHADEVFIALLRRMRVDAVQAGDEDKIVHINKALESATGVLDGLRKCNNSVAE